MSRRYLRSHSIALAVVFGFGTLGVVAGDPEVRPGLWETPLGDAAEIASAKGTAASSTRPLSLKAAVTRALQYSEQIAALRAAVTLSEREYEAANDVNQPELRFSWSRDSSETDRLRLGPYSEHTAGRVEDQGDQLRVGLRFYPPNPLTWQAAAGQAEAVIRAARAELAAAENLLAAQVRRLYAEIQYLTMEARITAGLVELEKIIMDATKSKADANQAVAADVSRTMRRYLRALANRDQVNQQREMRRRELAALVNLPAATLELESVPFVPGTNYLSDLAAERLLLEALQHRPDLEALQWRLVAAQKALSRASKAKIPWFRFVEISGATANETSRGSDTTMRPNNGTFEIQNIDDRRDATEFRVDFGINLELFPWADHSKRTLEAGYELAHARYREAFRRVSRQVHDAVEGLRNVCSQCATFDAEVVPLEAEMRQTIEDLQSETALAPDELAALKIDLLESMRLRLEARFRHQLAVIELESALGRSNACF